MKKYRVTHTETGKNCVIEAENEEQLLKKLDSGHHTVLAPVWAKTATPLNSQNAAFEEITS